MATVTRSKLAAKDMGDPKTTLGTKDKAVLGTIIGYATDVSRRKDPSGEKEFLGLAGSFEAIPADPKMDTVQSGICYLPGGMDGPMIAALQETDDKGKRKNPSVEFAIEISVIKAKNPQGYSWEARPVVPVKSSGDVLDNIRQQLKGLPAPKK
jgi:hypothetical protein